MNSGYRIKWNDETDNLAREAEGAVECEKTQRKEGGRETQREIAQATACAIRDMSSLFYLISNGPSVSLGGDDWSAKSLDKHL